MNIGFWRMEAGDCIFKELLEMDEYKTEAKKFIEETGTTFKAEFLRHGLYFPGDKESRDIYKITLTRGSRGYSFNFGQSINASGKFIFWGPKGKELLQKKPSKAGYDCKRNKSYSEPGPYDVLAGMQKYDPGSFENFCGDFGYNTDSREAEKTYKAVVEEYQNLKMLYNEQELEVLQRIG
jgi:hypothetical protein